MIEDQLHELALMYRQNLKDRMAEREHEMASDNTSHYMVYRLLGVTYQEGYAIDLY